MKFFKFAYFVGAIVIFVLNMNNKPLSDKALKSNFTSTSGINTIQPCYPDIFIPFDIENCETLEDDNESETELKLISTTYFTPTHFTSTSLRYIPKVVVEKVPSFFLFFQSWQSFLQVFRI